MNYGFEIVCASVFTVICIISARVYSLLNLAYTYWDKKKIKGPLPRYIFGTWNGFAEKVLGQTDYSNTITYGKVYGTYDGLTPNLLVTDVNLIQEILVSSADKFQDIRSASENSIVLRDSLQSLCGSEKAEVQSLTASLLNSSKLEKLIPKLKLSAEALINIITKARQDDGFVNVTSAVKEFVEETTALAIFGIDLNADVSFRDEFVKNYDQILKVDCPKSMWSLMPFLYEDYFNKAWVCPEKSLQYFVNLIISGISECPTVETSDEKTAATLIELFVLAAEEEKKLVKTVHDEKPELVLTDNTIISKCFASILSLKNAVRTTVLLGIYALANDEEVQETLYKEVKQNKSEALTYEGILQLNFLDKTLKEILRMYPFEYRLERVTKDAVKLGEVTIEEKTRVSIPLYALHRLEEYYPEPDKFNPERFSENASSKRDPFAYLSFGQAGYNGSDISLQLLILVSKITLLMLVEKFKFSIPQKLDLYRLFESGFTRIPEPKEIKVLIDERV